MSRRTVQDIDISLKAAFDDIANQAVPDEFIELLKKLREVEFAAASKKARGNEDV